MTRTTLFERLLAKRKPLIFDFDDAIWKMDVSEGNERLKWMKNPAKTSKLIKIASHVIAGNEYLANYARQFNSKVTVIPTTVDTNVFKPIKKIQNSQLVIGWSGSKTTVKHFELALPVLQKLKQEYGNRLSFKLIGDANYVNEALQLKGVAWNNSNEINELAEIDIGLMPLPDDEWSKGKCGLKGLSYMALGIPTVMSAVGVNKDIIQHGENGFLYSNNNELEVILKNLIEHQELRSEIGKKGIITVEKIYSVEANKIKYLNVIKEVFNTKKN